jgi:hypothetical protein
LFKLHFMDEPGRVELLEGTEAEVVAAILAAHPTRQMELWQRSRLVRILGPRPQSSFLAGPGRQPSRHQS